MLARLCVFCGQQPAEPQWDPFCSERCRLQDLANWIDGGYRVPAEPVTDAGPGIDGTGMAAGESAMPRRGASRPRTERLENNDDDDNE